MMGRDEFKIELEKWTRIGKTVSMLYLMTGHIMNNNTFRHLLSKTGTKAIRTVQYAFGQFKCKSDDLLFDTLDISLDIFPKSLYLSEVFYGDYFDLHAINNKLWDHIEKKTGFAEIKNQIEVHASAIEKRFELWDSCLLYLDVFLKLQEIYLEKAKQSNLLPQTNIELLEKAKEKHDRIPGSYSDDDESNEYNP